jgi:hypothetical protein
MLHAVVADSPGIPMENARSGIKIKSKIKIKNGN